MPVPSTGSRRDRRCAVDAPGTGSWTTSMCRRRSRAPCPGRRVVAHLGRRVSYADTDGTL